MKFPNISYNTRNIVTKVPDNCANIFTSKYLTIPVHILRLILNFTFEYDRF